MSARVYRLTPSAVLTLTALAGPNLDSISLHLAEGVYTTVRTYRRDRILGLSAHLRRLIDSLEIVGRPRPVDLPALRSGLRQIIQRENREALRLRITVPFETEDVYISVEPFTSFPPDDYRQGVRCVTSRLERSVPTAKHTSFIAPSRSARATTDPEVHEILMVNEAGEILEGFASNFFAVMEGTLYTAGQDVLAGVTRQIVLAEASAILPVWQKPVRVDDLPRLTEAFITSSGREVMPVRQIDAVVIGAPGPVTRDLMARYHDHVMQDAELP
jgi:branched-chain amino acid aminotransferase